MSNSFRYASKNRPCVICHATDDCRETFDGVVFCKSNRDSYCLCHGYRFGNLSGGGTEGTFGVWFPEGSDGPRGQRSDSGPLPPGRKREPIDVNAKCMFTSIERVRRDLSAREAREITGLLDLPPSLAHHWQIYDYDDRLSPAIRAFTMPEWGFDGDGTFRVVSHCFRYPSGKKRTHGDLKAPVKRGITLLDDWDQGGPVYLVEGPSDTLTLHGMGLTAIGRPSNLAGAEIIARFLAMTDGIEGREIIVVGENDQKQDEPGKPWPGRDGAFSVGQKIADLLPLNRVSVAMAPDGFKDARDWFKAKWKANSSPKALAVPFAKELLKRVLKSKDVTPQFETTPATEPTPPVDAAHVAAHIARVFAPPPPPTPEMTAAAKLLTKQARADMLRYRCSDPRSVVLLNKHTFEPRYQTVRCMKSGCCGCRRYLIRRELINLELRWKALPYLYEMETTEENWPSLCRRLRRAGAQYVRVRDEGGAHVERGNILVVCDRPVANLPLLLTASGAAVDAVSRVFEAGWNGKRPISTSRAWKLPDLREGDKVFERIGNGKPNMAPKAFEEIAERYGAEVVRTGTPPDRPSRTISSVTLRRAVWTREAGEAAALDMVYQEIAPGCEPDWTDWRRISSREKTLAEELTSGELQTAS